MRERFPVLVASTLLAAGLAVLAGAGLPNLPKDRVLQRGPDSPGPVVFSHVSHVDEQKTDCTSCHPGRFRILRSTTGELRVTHEQMEAGRQCGACHDGKAARGLEDCAACHRDE